VFVPTCRRKAWRGAQTASRRSLPQWHTLMENCSGLVVAATSTQATGTAEREAAEEMIARYSRGGGAQRIRLGADKGYEAAAFVADLRALNVTSHIAQNISGRRSATYARTTRHPGYAASQQKRKRSIEEPFGWGKTIGGLARPMPHGAKKLGFKFILTMASYNLIRCPSSSMRPDDSQRMPSGRGPRPHISGRNSSTSLIELSAVNSTA